VNMVIRNEAGDHITALDIVEKMGASERHQGVLALLKAAQAKTAAMIEGEGSGGGGGEGAGDSSDGKDEL
jgi:hypothetical protein